MIIGINGKIGSGKDLVGQIMQVLSCDAPDYINTDSMHDIKAVLNWLNSNEDTPWEEMMFPDHKITMNFLSKHKTVEIKKFAGKLKEIAAILIGCDVSDFEDREFKEKELGEEWWYYCNSLFFNGETKMVSYSEAGNTIKDNTSWYIVKLTPRKLLQLLGTEAGRNIIHPNIWVNALFADYKPIGDNLLEGEVRKVREEDLIYPNWIITDVRFPNEAKAIKDRGGVVIKINKPQYLDNGLVIRKDEHLSEKALDDYEFDHVIDNSGSIEELVEKVKQLNLV